MVSDKISEGEGWGRHTCGEFTQHHEAQATRAGVIGASDSRCGSQRVLPASRYLFRAMPDKEPQPQPRALHGEADDLLFIGTRAINEILFLDSEFCTTIRCEENISISEIERLFNQYRTRVLNITANLFTKYTGSECAVCIKQLNMTDTGLYEVDYDNYHLPMNVAYHMPFVYTFARDSGSSGRRAADAKDGLGIYPFSENSGLAQALENGYWYCNDLGSLGAGYNNANPEWPALYNATAIAALKYPSKEGVVCPLGLLCVDNKDGGFDDLSCRQILEIIANIFYYTTRLLISTLTSKGKPDGQARR